MPLGEAAEACLLAFQAWLLALAATALACVKLATVGYHALLGLPGVQLIHRLAQRAAPVWALGSLAHPAAARSHADALSIAEPPAAPEQAHLMSAGGGPPQPRRRSSAVLRASSSELEPIAENVAEEAGWGGAELWKAEEEGEEAAEPPYTRLASLSLPASQELPVGAAVPSKPAHHLHTAIKSLEEEPLLQKAPTSTSPVTATEEADAAAAAQQAQQAAEAAATAFAAEAAAAACGSSAEVASADQPARRPASVENAEGADALLGGGSAASAEPAKGAAGSAGDDAALLPAELPPALPPAEVSPALPPAEIPPALPPIPVEAIAEVPILAASWLAQSPPGTGGVSGTVAGGSGAAAMGGAMLRSPPRGLEEEEEPGGAQQSGSPTVMGAGAAALGPAGMGGTVPMPESLAEGPVTAVPPPIPLPLSAAAPASFEAAAAALGSGGPTFSAAGGKLGAAYQLRGTSGSGQGTAGNPFGPATPSIDRAVTAAEPAGQASPPVLPPPPPASRAGTAFARELAAAAADLVDGAVP
ncbi:hypothetical protein C2E21_5564 isoform C [Chlorella sorokiniana]|uniref:Uncharacterized protein n=1 Tax=Chlorella sorokiniana TaxID=3076 RepID=A0A2P6TN59_CHLSO|nr:hypothetical protein C2E21_5564 isoform C [Chlorella sorokiniana]|eukprot:PRW50758.1 hypothetical protein C2E21_5564 isoform C [Chlorella sorokiniana]